MKALEKLARIQEILMDARDPSVEGWWPDDVYKQKQSEIKGETLAKLTFKDICKLINMVDTEIDVVKRNQ
jgi:hypothetical protein